MKCKYPGCQFENAKEINVYGKPYVLCPHCIGDIEIKIKFQKGYRERLVKEYNEKQKGTRL